MPPVAITIDTEFPDQPARDPLGSLSEQLDILGRREVRATFFIVGAWARAHPEKVMAIRERGHQIGNHSYSHCPLSRLTAGGIVQDLLACRDVLAGLGIETRPFFRAPQGELGHDNVDVEAAIRQAGYRHIHWHARGEDWRPAISPEQVAETVVSEVQTRWPRPAIVLLHSWPEPTPRALDLVLERLQAADASFLTVDQLDWRQALAGRGRELAKRLKAG